MAISGDVQRNLKIEFRIEPSPTPVSNNKPVTFEIRILNLVVEGHLVPALYVSTIQRYTVVLFSNNAWTLYVNYTYIEASTRPIYSTRRHLKSLDWPDSYRGYILLGINSIRPEDCKTKTLGLMRSNIKDFGRIQFAISVFNFFKQWVTNWRLLMSLRCPFVCHS